MTDDYVSIPGIEGKVAVHALRYQEIPPAEVEKHMQERGLKILTPREFWQVVDWAEQNCPEMYNDIKRYSHLEVLNGIVAFGEETGDGKGRNCRLATTKYNKQGRIYVPAGEERTDIIIPAGNKISEYCYSYEFNRDAVNPETGFPIRADKDGKFDMLYKPSTKKCAVVVDAVPDLTLNLDSNPDLVLDFIGTSEFGIRKVRAD